MNEGEIYDAEVRGKEGLTPEDAALELLQWISGNFEFNTEDVYTPKVAVNAPTQELILEAAQRMNEAS